LENTGAATVNLNSLGVKNIKRQGGGSLVSGDLPAGGMVQLLYDGTEFQLQLGYTAPSITIPTATDPYIGIRANSAGTGYEVGPSEYSPNLVINPEIMIDQRLEGNALALAHDGVTTAISADRMKTMMAMSTFHATVQRGSALNAMRNSLVYTVVTGQASLAASNYVIPFLWRFLGYDVAHLKGEFVTAAFLFKSNVTGTFSAALISGDGQLSYVFDFSYPTAGDVVLVTKLIFIPIADVITDTTTGIGLQLLIASVAGTDRQTIYTDSWAELLVGSICSSITSTNWTTTAGNYVAVSGLHLRRGQYYIPLERGTRSDYLSSCQAYFCKTYDDGVAVGTGTNPETAVTWQSRGTYADQRDACWSFPKSMIFIPTPTVYSPSTGDAGYIYNVNLPANRAAVAGNYGKRGIEYVHMTDTTGLADYHVCTCHFTAEAEL